ncbi:MAG: hypothetical protein LBG86_01200 [Puniceicoccales bacterium]|jgi:transcriptional repressor NrdR|nr:hypothetical protein [Puniceicoccales bacterium]
MQCLHCHSKDTRVIDTRQGARAFSIKRRRVCNSCGFRFSTTEIPIREEIMVRKRDGRLEEFDRQKIQGSLQAALKKGSFQEKCVETLVDEILAVLLENGKKQLDSTEIGVAVLKKLKQLDELAYLRYLSVHQTFSNLEDFRKKVFNGGGTCGDPV